MPRIQTIDIYTNSQRVTNQYKGISTIDKYYLTNNCILCNSFSGNKGTCFIYIYIYIYIYRKYYYIINFF